MPQRRRRRRFQHSSIYRLLLNSSHKSWILFTEIKKDQISKIMRTSTIVAMQTTRNRKSIVEWTAWKISFVQFTRLDKNIFPLKDISIFLYHAPQTSVSLKRDLNSPSFWVVSNELVVALRKLLEHSKWWRSMKRNFHERNPMKGEETHRKKSAF